MKGMGNKDERQEAQRKVAVHRIRIKLACNTSKIINCEINNFTTKRNPMGDRNKLLETLKPQALHPKSSNSKKNANLTKSNLRVS